MQTLCYKIFMRVSIFTFFVFCVFALYTTFCVLCGGTFWGLFCDERDRILGPKTGQLSRYTFVTLF
jgi:hypothetical protein